ncbi:MAG: hypothetical protein ACE1ZY_02525 [Alphaproteobacteria bacterium]
MSPHAIRGDTHAGVPPFHGYNGQTHRVVYGREHTDHEQADAHLQGRCGEAGGKRGQADAKEKHAHHAIAAPFIGEPAGGQREEAECKEAGRCIGQKLGVSDPPFPIKHQRRDGGENEGEQVVEEMTDVQQQKVQTIPDHELVLSIDGRARLTITR